LTVENTQPTTDLGLSIAPAPGTAPTDPRDASPSGSGRGPRTKPKALANYRDQLSIWMTPLAKDRSNKQAQDDLCRAIDD